jgi:hypothetical protein
MQDGPAGVAEHIFDTFVLQRLDDDLGTTQFHVNDLRRGPVGPPIQTADKNITGNKTTY